VVASLLGPTSVVAASSLPVAELASTYSKYSKRLVGLGVQSGECVGASEGSDDGLRVGSSVGPADGSRVGSAVQSGE